ncbi:MAG: YidC/Oxa1 family insertase periplasmic-domain containing protein [Gemmataceae bacterium]
MQQQVPIRNYVYFFLTTIAIFVGYTKVREYLYPPPPPQEKIWAHDKVTKDQQREALVRLTGAVTGRGMADAVDLTVQYMREPVAPAMPEPKWAYDHAPRDDQNAIIAHMAVAGFGGPMDVAAITQAYAFNPRFLARLAEVAVPVEEIVIGGKDFPITATLTPKGAGVAELILNDFQAADSYGLPVKVNGHPKPVTLIPRIADAPPAFSIFHYAQPDDNEPQPLDTLGHAMWTVERKVVDGNRHEVVFTTELANPGVRITKTFSLAQHEYHVGLTVRVEKLSAAAGTKFRYQLAGARGLPIEGEWYTTTFRNSHVGLLDNRDVIYRLSADAATLDRLGGSDRYRKDDKRIVYAATVVQYFGSAIAVDDLAADGSALPVDKQGFLQFARATVEKSEGAKRANFADITVRAISEPVDVSTGIEHRYVLYHGPVKVRQLTRLTDDKAVDPSLVDRYADSLKLRSLTDYGNFGIWTNAIIFFTNLVHWLVGFLHKFLPAGIVIVCVTIIVRGSMFPLSRKQAMNMQITQEKMQKLGPEMKLIEQQYKDDFLAKQQAQRELYRKHNVNPAAGLSGCLMLALQMPIFMGLYYALQESVFFRLERFLWIPNLAAPDMLLWWGENIPYISQRDAMGTFLYLGPYLNILPLIGVVLIFIQQQKAAPPTMTDEQRQQQTMMKFMTGFMALMFYKVPAGLSLYFIASSVWGLLERRFVKKKLEATAAARAAASPVTKNGKSKAKPSVKEPSRLALWWEKVLREASKK